MRSLAGMIATLAVAAAAPVTASASATVTTEAVRIPVDTVQENPCTGEPIAVTGFVEAVSHDTVDASGGMTSINFGAFHGTAVGLVSGTRYVSQNVQLDNEGHFSATGAVETTDVFSIRFVSAGAGGDFTLHLMHHETVDANGNRTASPLVFRTECSG